MTPAELYSGEDLAKALGVRVTWSLHENAHRVVDLTDRIDKAGIGVDRWGAPGVTSPRAAFMRAVGTTSDTRVLQGHTRTLSCAPLSDARSKGNASAAINLRILTDARSNLLEQVSVVTCDEAGQLEVAYKDCIHTEETDIIRASMLEGRLSESVSKYGDRVTTGDLRSWIARGCRKMGGIPFISTKGDWYVPSLPDLEENNPAFLMQLMRDMVESLPGSYNKVSVMLVWPSPTNQSDVQFSVKQYAQSELARLTGEIAELKALGPDAWTKRSPAAVDRRMSEILHLRRRVEEMHANLRGSADYLLNEMDEALASARTAYTKVQEGTHGN